MKKQIIFIRGGETFANKENFYKYLRTVTLDPYKEKKVWRDWLIEALKDTYDVLSPVMPAKQNSDYVAWKIWFERHFDFIFDEKPILVGHSLGATFLLKYLSENNFPKEIIQLHLVAPYVTDEGVEGEDIATFAFEIKDINKISNFCNDIHLWHSRDDAVVPFKNSEIVKENLPDANFHIFEDRGHFAQPIFIEILEVINKVK